MLENGIYYDLHVKLSWGCKFVIREMIIDEFSFDYRSRQWKLERIQGLYEVFFFFNATVVVKGIHAMLLTGIFETISKKSGLRLKQELLKKKWHKPTCASTLQNSI